MRVNYVIVGDSSGKDHFFPSIEEAQRFIRQTQAAENCAAQSVSPAALKGLGDAAYRPTPVTLVCAEARQAADVAAANLLRSERFYDERLDEMTRNAKRAEERLTAQNRELAEQLDAVKTQLTHLTEIGDISQRMELDNTVRAYIIEHCVKPELDKVFVPGLNQKLRDLKAENSIAFQGLQRRMSAVEYILVPLNASVTRIKAGLKSWFSNIVSESL